MAGVAPVTVLVLVHGRAVTFGPGNVVLDKVDAILSAWRPGEEGGTVRLSLCWFALCDVCGRGPACACVSDRTSATVIVVSVRTTDRQAGRQANARKVRLRALIYPVPTIPHRTQPQRQSSTS